MSVAIGCQQKRTSQTILLVGINARYSHSCLALFYLRHQLGRFLPQYHCQIVQFSINDPYFEMLLDIAGQQPHAVLLSAAIWNSDLVEKLALDLHGLLPDCPVIIGGPQAGVLRQALPRASCTTVLGAIETVAEQFYRDLHTKQLQPLYQAQAVPLSQRGFAFPYTPADFAEHLRHRHVYYESSRGCPYACSYCRSASERGVYHKDLAQVFDELAAILCFQPKELRFVDRTFNDLPERALAIWQFLCEQKKSTRCHCEIAPQRFTAAMFDFLATVPAGLLQFEIGIQSTNATVLAAINRSIDIKEAAVTVRKLAELERIHLHVDLILGLPEDTPESFLCSFAEVFAMGPHYIQMGLLKILPDTPIEEQADDWQYRYCSRPPYAVYANRWLDAACLAELYWFGETVEKFYNNRYFVSLWRYLREGQEDIAGFFMALERHCRQKGLLRHTASQETLAAALADFLHLRSDWPLVSDLLRYDWLRCGLRSLPEFLAMESGRETPQESRDYFYRELPAAVPGLYTSRERNYFCKRLCCLRLIPAAMAQLGLPGNGRLCFLPEKDSGLFSYQRVMTMESFIAAGEKGLTVSSGGV